MCSCLLLRIYHFPLKKTTSTCYRFKGDSTQPAVLEPIYTTAPKGDKFSAVVKKSITTYTQPLSTSICQVCNHHPHGIGQNQTKTHKRAKPTRQLLNQLNQDKTTQSLYRLKFLFLSISFLTRWTWSVFNSCRLFQSRIKGN